VKAPGAALTFLISGIVSGFLADTSLAFLAGVPFALVCSSFYVKERNALIALAISVLWIACLYLGILGEVFAEGILIPGVVGACGVSIILALQRRAFFSLRVLSTMSVAGLLGTVPFIFLVAGKARGGLGYSGPTWPLPGLLVSITTWQLAVGLCLWRVANEHAKLESR
jgi:hypothetical protein